MGFFFLVPKSTQIYLLINLPKEEIWIISAVKMLWFFFFLSISADEYFHFSISQIIESCHTEQHWYQNHENDSLWLLYGTSIGVLKQQWTIYEKHLFLFTVREKNNMFVTKQSMSPTVFQYSLLSNFSQQTWIGYTWERLANSLFFFYMMFLDGIFHHPAQK